MGGIAFWSCGEALVKEGEGEVGIRRQRLESEGRVLAAQPHARSTHLLTLRDALPSVERMED